MADRMFRQMDSLRVSLLRRGPEGVRVVDARAVLRAPAAGVADASEAWTLPEVRPPFGFYIFRGEAHDSLRREVETVNAEIRRLRSLQASRLRELARDLPADRSLVDRSDPELVRLQRAVTEVDRRAAALRDALDRAARREPGTPFSEPFGGWAPSGDPEPRAVRFRPLDPYLLGQNRAAGAEVVDLQPELAEYFQVEGGVLVVDVPAGTPAARAGIQPGDVVTNVGDLDVASIQELRQGLAATDSSIPVTVVRKGRRIQLLLPR
jgi:hypothetical protein